MGKNIIFGIRPENIHDSDFVPPNIDVEKVAVKVDVTELMGNEIFLYLVSGKNTFVARVDPRSSSARRPAGGCGLRHGYLPHLRCRPPRKPSATPSNNFDLMQAGHYDRPEFFNCKEFREVDFVKTLDNLMFCATLAHLDALRPPNAGYNLSFFYWLPTNHNVRNFNKHAAVDLIRFAGKGLSRTDLAEEMGITKAAVTIIINDLIAHGIIIETESRTTSSWPAACRA